jgi:hypothetical protein
VKFVEKTCPIANVFNQTNEKCTNIRKGINNPPKLSYIEGKACKGIQGYYCKNNKYTYCTEDNLKIVRNKPCPGRMPCRRGKTNPCNCDDDCWKNSDNVTLLSFTHGCIIVDENITCLRQQTTVIVDMKSLLQCAWSRVYPLVPNNKLHS